MSLAATLVMIAQATTASAGASTVPIAESASASARILRPAIIRLEKGDISIETRAPRPQHSRDANGRNWIEFS